MAPAGARPDIELDPGQVARLYADAAAETWGVSAEAFRARLQAAASHAFDTGQPSAAEIARLLDSLHVADLALVIACEAGRERAWERVLEEHQPALRRAGAAIDPTGRAADLADALFADLYGTDVRNGERRSLFRYFHGRSRLGTWLRAVLAQRHVDRVRQDRRTESLEDDHEPAAAPAPVSGNGHPDHARFTSAMDAALRKAIEALPPRDRLLLGCYYAQDMTLAAIGRMLREHEATVSRHLSRIRRELRDRVETHLRVEHAMDDAAVAECFRAVAADAGPLNLKDWLGSDEPALPEPAGRKNARAGRSST